MRLYTILTNILMEMIQLEPETLSEAIVSGPLCITDLFQNKSAVYFYSIIIFIYFFLYFSELYKYVTF